MASSPPITPVGNPNQLLPPSTPSSPRRKSFSFPHLKSSTLALPKPEKEGEKGGKVKAFLGKLGPSNKKPSSTSLSSSIDDKPINSPPSDVSTTRTPSREALKVNIGHSSSLATPMATEGDLFQQSVASASRTVNRLTTVNAVLTGVAAGLALGAGWLPGVGEGVKLIIVMLDQAKTVNVGKVASLRLVSLLAIPYHCLRGYSLGFVGLQITHSVMSNVT